MLATMSNDWPLGSSKHAGWESSLEGYCLAGTEAPGDKLRKLREQMKTENTLSWKKIPSSSNHNQYLLRDQPEDLLCCRMGMLSIN